MINPIHKKLILASSSKARISILKKLSIYFETFSPKIDETILKNEKPSELVKRLSLLKAQKAKKANEGSYIIAADTVVFARKKIFLKTLKKKTALNNLISLSGRRHTIFTGLTFVNPNNEVKFTLSKTKIKFKSLDKFDIEKYIQSGEWKGKAGSYAVQGYASSFIHFISGSYTSAIGLPIEKVYYLLKMNKFL